MNPDKVERRIDDTCEFYQDWLASRILRKGLQRKSFFGEVARAKRASLPQKRLQRKARPERGNGVSS